MRRLLACAFVIAIVLGCATGESLDEGQGIGGSTASGGNAGSAGKVDDPTGGAGGSGSGSGGAGGSVATGGSAGSGSGSSTGGTGAGSGGDGGTSASGGSAGSAGCGSNEKQCGGVCIQPMPGVGCSLANCDPCPAPPINSIATCNGTTCDFNCNSGFVKQGAQCVSTGSGGTGGTGSGGTGGTGSGGTGSGGTGGGTGCPQACDPSAGEQQFICTFLCATQGKFGLCAPVLNCCVCA